MSRKVMIIGHGGHSKVITDVIKTNPHLELAGYLDDKYDQITYRNGLYYGPVLLASQFIKRLSVRLIIGIGNNEVRQKVAQKLNIPPEFYMTLAHRSAVISSSASIGSGTVVMANAVINADSQVGSHCIINTGAVVEHDNVLGDFVHISPNATLAGAVKINEGAHVGAGVTVIPGKKVGEWSVIGAGATVITNIPSHCTAVGVPAKMKVKEL
ncbi:acetyltransferase [Salipaludibacillus sp. CUR1]|uniref:acetyltransferase n=1 Tax=Salipaludibacillus sp. CUR1 TaxID=2820003 RepID=UPI001E63D9DF|nr:acetyltransferase [Salipaludibacillus sp. CUR1]MCE7792510.1 acetyltransferase [Salipaludibacillus sp. CUR1]